MHQPTPSDELDSGWQQVPTYVNRQSLDIQSASANAFRLIVVLFSRYLPTRGLT